MQNWVDFAQIKQTVPLAPLLRQYGVQLRRSGPDQYRGCCPIHKGEGSNAFHVNVTKNVFHCFACGAAGTVLDFVAAMDQCSVWQAALKLTQPTTAASQPAPVHPTQLVTKESRPPAPLGFTLRGVDGTHPYLAARGVAISTAERFGIGFYAGSGIFSQRLVIPIHNERGQLVAYCGRAVDSSLPRYRFPSRFPKSELLFNMHRAIAAGHHCVVVVEGFFDCLKLHQAGVHSVVALMGSVLYQPQQRALLEHFRRVILMLDGDAAGRSATVEIGARLRPLCPVQLVHLPDRMQPDGMSADAIHQALKSSRTLDAAGPVR